MQEALDRANLTEKDLSAVAVTIGPGLSLCLRGKLREKVFIHVLRNNQVSLLRDLRLNVSFLSNVVGVRKARKVAGSFNLPIVGVHHMEAHALVAR